MYDFYEFFAGGGMARLGLGQEWRCVFANDIDERKARAYREYFKGAEEWFSGDVASVKSSDLPGIADLAWASFPCQDLSLAGSGGGLNAKRSGTFWPFWRLMQGLAQEGRGPRFIVLENVYGALTSHGGADFMAIAKALIDSEYRFGAMVINAVHFVPQSRPRLFIIAIQKNIFIPESLIGDAPEPLWNPPVVITRSEEIKGFSPDSWLWWKLPPPPPRKKVLADLIEDNPQGVAWHPSAETKRLLGMMSEVNLAKVRKAKVSKHRMIGAIYKRIRKGVQRAEIRFDGLSGCLRTPVGGSSRQIIMIINGNYIRSRLLSPREAARLMGLPENYKLPEKYNDAYHLAGDGLVVPVVRYLAENILEPTLKQRNSRKEKAA
jgi:DNA (cytosine-5)-methyltransferase 1